MRGVQRFRTSSKDQTTAESVGRLGHAARVLVFILIPVPTAGSTHGSVS